MTFKQLIQLLPKPEDYICREVFLVSAGCIWLFCSFHVSECLETGGD